MTALRIALARRQSTATHLAEQLGVHRNTLRRACERASDAVLRWRIEKLFDEAIFSLPREFAQMKAVDARFGGAPWTMRLPALAQLCGDHGAELRGVAARLKRSERRRALILALGKTLSAHPRVASPATFSPPSLSKAVQ